MGREGLMNGAVFYASKYGSTAEYAGWIGDTTGLAVYDIRGDCPGLAEFDFLVLGSPVIYHKLLFSKWVRRNLSVLLNKQVILFTVSGAPAGEKLDAWIAASLPESLIRSMRHVVLRGRQNPKDLSRFDRMMLTIAGLANRDRQAAREEMHGFDFMDRASIQPVVDMIEEFKRADAVSAALE